MRYCWNTYTEILNNFSVPGVFSCRSCRGPMNTGSGWSKRWWPPCPPSALLLLPDRNRRNLSSSISPPFSPWCWAIVGSSSCVTAAPKGSEDSWTPCQKMSWWTCWKTAPCRWWPPVWTVTPATLFQKQKSGSCTGHVVELEPLCIMHNHSRRIIHYFFIT